MYQEEIKNKAREMVIKESINALTTNRNDSTLSCRTYVRELKKYFLKNEDIDDKVFASFLKEDEINRWENFYDSIVQSREAKNLKIAYLAGPNPEKYLSGNVKKKYNEVLELVESNRELEDNLASLKEILPKDLKATDISVSLGTSWIPMEYYEEFFKEHFKIEKDDFNLIQNSYTGQWTFDGLCLE